MYIFDKYNLDIGLVLIGVMGVTIILLLFVIVLLAKIGNLNKKYKKFMGGSDAKTLEEQIISRFSELDELKKNDIQIKNKLDKVSENLFITYQKMGIVKYDAFKEMGGKLSFAMALLNKNNDGFILNSMHSSREGCYTYVKEIIKGESFVMLADEEKAALAEAIRSSDYMS